MPDETAAPPPFHHPLRSATLATRKPTRFDLRPDRSTRDWMATQLGLIALPAFRFVGEIRPAGREDFTLEAKLTAEAVQPCSVTLAPVTAHLTEDVRRHYIAKWQEPEGDEVEMPEDDSEEPLPETIDLALVALEALELSLPLYPRAEGVALGEAVFAAPGTAPLRDEDLRPFAGLAALKSRLDGSDQG